MPLAVKLHTDQLLTIVIKHRDIDITREILSVGPHISKDYLQDNFGSLGQEKLPNSQNFLNLVNMLQSGVETTEQKSKFESSLKKMGQELSDESAAIVNESNYEGIPESVA